MADFNIVRLFGGLVEGSLLAKFEVLGANDWKVIFDNITFKGESIYAYLCTTNPREVSSKLYRDICLNASECNDHRR